MRKIKKLLYKKITHKTNLTLLGDFNMTLGNNDESMNNKDFSQSRVDLMSLMIFGDAKTRRSLICVVSWQD